MDDGSFDVKEREYGNGVLDEWHEHCKKHTEAREAIGDGMERIKPNLSPPKISVNILGRGYRNI